MNISIGSDIKNLRLVENKVDEIVSQLNINRDEYGRIMVATMEAVNNAIVHGNQYDRKKSVDIIFEYGNNDFTVRVLDQGKGFNPDCVPDPTSPENIENIRGRGVYLMRNLADDIGFNEKGTEVIMKFKFEAVEAQDSLS